MKRDKMLLSMDLIDEKYIKEADPCGKRGRSGFWIRFGAIAACIGILITSFALWLFLPFNTDPPDVSRYSGSEYYPIIERLNKLTYRAPSAMNNFQLYGFAAKKESLDFAANDVAADTASSGQNRDPSPESDKYVETTDNQVSGVIEGDIVKRSDRYIYYLRGDELSVYSIEGRYSRLVGSYTIDLGKGNYGYYEAEAYLSEDCDTFTVLVSRYNHTDRAVTLVSLDVSDPSDISEKGRVSVSGFYVSSRLVDGRLMMITDFYLNAHGIDFSDETTFIPQIDTGEGKKSIPMEDIVCPDEPTVTGYTVISMFDPESLEVIGNTAYLSYSDKVYVSSDSLYVTRQFYDVEEKDGKRYDRVMTEIARMSYGEGGFEFKNFYTVQGFVKDQYSLDEHEGILRVVTTTSCTVTDKKNYGLDSHTYTFVGEKLNASLYCIDIESGKTVASDESFAPEGETVRSVRFDGDAAYVCTSIQLSDPVFFFDLSDLDNITRIDTGTIEGFSSSLVNFSDGNLIGIGQGDSWSTVKIEVYREQGDEVISVCDYQIGSASYSEDYKSYLVDRENSLVGLAIRPYGGEEYYLLLHFDGESLTAVLEEPISGELYKTRAIYIDGYLYMLYTNGFKVKACEF